MPKFDYKEIANLVDYAQVVAQLPQPKWRQELLKKFGPSGIDWKQTGTKLTKSKYGDYSKMFLWLWDEKELGRLYLDSERTVYFDGQNFMLRVRGEPDDERIKGKSLSLVTWLTEMVRDRDESLLEDKKWINKHLWHEFIRITKVSACNVSLYRQTFFIRNSSKNFIAL